MNNLNYILKIGKLTSSSHRLEDRNFTAIGDNELIEYRAAKEIPISPFGKFSDYVSFYFGPLSPMLFNIQRGYKNVLRRSAQEIIYLLTSFDVVKQFGVKFVFTDGHGYHSFSQFFNDEKNFDKVDFETAKSKVWFDTEEDPDRKRRKQAEFLIYRELDFNAIKAIAVYDENTADKIEEALSDYDYECKVIVKPNWYYD